MQSGFYKYHPFISFLYFFIVIGFSLYLNNPLCLIISFVASVFVALSINNKQNLSFLVKLCLPMALLAAVINPFFNHRGTKILLYFSNGNPVTLESIFYGVFMGLMLMAVVFWFSSFNKIITTDKFIYLFGKIIPAISLVLSMALRFFGKFKAQMQSVIESQKAMGKDLENGSLINKIKVVVSVFVIMISWSFENAVDTADSMKSRGYGLKKRTTFSNYRFYNKDKLMLIFLMFCTAVLCYGIFSGVFNFSYFEGNGFNEITLKTLPFYIIYFAVCISPAIINLKEEIKWKALASKI